MLLSILELACFGWVILTVSGGLFLRYRGAGRVRARRVFHSPEFVPQKGMVKVVERVGACPCRIGPLIF